VLAAQLQADELELVVDEELLSRQRGALFPTRAAARTVSMALNTADYQSIAKPAHRAYFGCRSSRPAHENHGGKTGSSELNRGFMAAVGSPAACASADPCAAATVKFEEGEEN